MISLEDFHSDFLQSIYLDTESRGLMMNNAFFENVCEELNDSADLTNNYTIAEYTKKGLEVNGYDYDDERKILSLIVQQFYQEEEIQTLTKSQIDIKFNRLKSFFIKSSEALFNNIEITSPAYSMAFNIYKYLQQNLVNKVRLMIITDGKMPRNLNVLPAETINNLHIEFSVIDIEYLYKIRLSKFNNYKSVIDVKLPCLTVHSESQDYQSYLAVVPGNLLVNIYEQYGQKLFEQNVRTFLQFKGNVNKGLRITIEKNPQLFFAYNNGITATASDIECDENNNIIKIENFQIVNGAQTTSAIYSANKNYNLDVSMVSVQMKLSVLKNADTENEFVSKISEYANTQNKVNKSDFFSNSPFHREMKTYSQRVWAPTLHGALRKSHWFYERARGEYLNEQLYLSKADKAKFILENPKKQYLDKTFLAKSENAWFQRPDVVSKGAQFSFSFFAESISNKLDIDNLAITEEYFRNVVSRVILFRYVENMISKAAWYGGGYRAQAVAYSIAYLSYIISESNMFLNFNLIWNEQIISAALDSILAKITKEIYNYITNPENGMTNISEWCKKPDCWERLKPLDFNIILDENILIGKEEQQYNKREDKKNKKEDSDIDIQLFVFNQDLKIWKGLLTFYTSKKSSYSLTSTQLSILEKMSLGMLMPPSEKQSKTLFQIFEQAKKEGF